MSRDQLTYYIVWYTVDQGQIRTCPPPPANILQRPFSIAKLKCPLLSPEPTDIRPACIWCLLSWSSLTPSLSLHQSLTFPGRWSRLPLDCAGKRRETTAMAGNLRLSYGYLTHSLGMRWRHQEFVHCGGGHNLGKRACNLTALFADFWKTHFQESE